MKYKEIKEKLTEKGFNLATFQTYNILDMLSFEHPNIDGNIEIVFSNKNKLPKSIEDDEEFDYDTAEWLGELKIQSITFNIDISISFMSDNTLDTCGDNDENLIYLHSKDLKLFGYVLDLVTNPYGMFDYIKKYNKEQEKFFNEIKKFLPAIQKYKLPHRVQIRNGNGNTLYPSYAIEFYIGEYDSLSFEFSTLSFKKSIFIALKPGGFDSADEGTFPINCDISVFENELDKQMKEREEFYQFLKERKNNR